MGLNNSQGTLPRLWCADAEENEVRMIEAREVAIATWVICVDSTPTHGNKYMRAGTMINPPPIPKSPAIKPTKAPSIKQIEKTSKILSTVQPYPCVDLRP
ncbi:hypothetical protein TUM4249_02080 [Shewanella sp. KT0246]|nr:hypothetical protein TUM4249_02080 [Shewanella sp. KT0246]